MAGKKEEQVKVKEQVEVPATDDTPDYAMEIEQAAKGQGLGMATMSANFKPFFRLVACGFLMLRDVLKK